jgi:hypothetical protein
MSQSIPITTPIIVELEAEEAYGMTPSGRSLSFKPGFKMYYMIHPDFKVHQTSIWAAGLHSTHPFSADE